MKQILVALLLFLQCSNHGWSVIATLPTVPAPKLTVTKVLAIAGAQLGKDAERYTIVAVDWCVASKFQPRYSDGSTYSPAGDERDAFCWFVTYLYHDAQAPRPGQPLNAVLVFRIKDDGSIGRLVSVRT